MAELIVRFSPRLKAGGVVTFVGSYINQAVYWEVVMIDPATGSEYPGAGTLEYVKTTTNKSKLSTNVYTCPTTLPGIPDAYDLIRVKWA